jgi:peptidoglycan/xylan/chitin deacetylase (PgdA/CDA1 family)
MVEGEQGHRQEDLATRRAERKALDRRQRRRRRFLAAGCLLLVAGNVLGLLAGVFGGNDESHDGIHAAKRSAQAPVHESGAGGQVRNASPQPGWKPHPGPVPILEYHVLGRPQTEVPYPDLYVPRASFRKQMDWLEAQGYEAVTLERVEEAWYDGATLPPKPMVVSFDDGYRPQYTFALPELRKHGWPGVLNLKAEGSDLYQSNVEAMLAAGWELAAHTINHSDLTTLDAAALEEEVAGSRRLLRRDYGVPVKNFCYPAGRFDASVIAAVEAAGYVGATTEIAGFATRRHPYELARIEVLGSWTLGDFAAAMRSGAEAAAP